MQNVAVYWDFENIHASLCTRINGATWYRENAFTKQPHLVDINSIMQYIAELGNVNINRAYANWSFLHAYSTDLQNHAIDLIQLFPRGRFGKNGADIRMSIEIIEDVAINDHIDVVVLIGGDSDYISVAQKVRQKGRSIIGIGIQETTNQFWVKSCNEFKYYSSLLVKSSKIENLEAEGYEIEDIDSAKELLKKAITGGGQDFILKAALKPLMQRFDPSFDESNYGFRSFSDFLAECRDVVEVSQGEHDHIVRLRIKGTTPEENPNPTNPPRGNFYEILLKKQQIRLVDPELLNQALGEVFAILHGQEVNNIDFKQQLMARMTDRMPQFGESDATKVRTLLYKSMAFRYLSSNQTTLVPEITSQEALAHRIRYTLVKRILDNIADEELDLAQLAEVTLGDRERVKEVEALVREYRQTG